MKSTLLAAAAAVLISHQAQAATFIVSGVGTVDSIASLTNGVYDATYDGSGAIRLGDTMRFSFELDTDQAVLTSLFDADPAINIYYFQPRNFDISLGTYTYKPLFSYIGDGSFQIWNNYGSTIPTDNQSFTFNGRGSDPLPFDLGLGNILESISLHAFDYSATARNSDLISEIAPYSAFSPVSFSWLEYNQTTQTSIHVGGTFRGQIVNSGVPEPSTWATMIIGFAAIGFGMRRRAAAVRYT